MRIVSTIFLIIPVFLFHVITVIRRMWKFIKYGGEILLLEQNEQPTIYKIYEKLKQNEPKGPNS